MDGGLVGRGDAVALGLVASCCEGSHTPAVHAARVAVSAELFLDSLLGEERRKTGWMRAEAAGNRVFGGSRPFCDAPLGMPMPCAILFGTTPWTLLLIPRRCW